MINPVRISFAKRCAWRAAYLYSGDRQVAHLGIDPGRHAARARVFAACCGRRFEAPLPFLRWRSGMGRVATVAYRASERIRLGLDGRFGWGVRK